ncbi:hypothetical protein J25TS5_49010 [Paenibacillus faecis]|uniref:tail fiber protein n=1 Tax=Paenibacillus faecis TaxID=862114 RepID=UPI001B1405BE|nr:phage tail protein [Paenibacillus faecis]GIO87969.1 hypothetical protein J25TS5_49010 [Paenibacillus faecis]
MASKTPNLDLLKKDPVADGNDTFNIQTMLNENWDKIDAAVGKVREELKEVHVPSATLTEPGIVQLSSATNSSSEALAATPKAVKSAYDAAVAAQSTANQAFQAGNERKAEVVAALVAKGIPATTAESWDTLIAKMAAIIRASGNATGADVLEGRTFSNAIGNNLAGAMLNQGAQNATLTNQGQQYNIGQGYHNGSGKITVSIDNLAAEIIKDGINVGGILGTLKPKLYYEISMGYIGPDSYRDFTIPFVPQVIFAYGDARWNSRDRVYTWYAAFNSRYTGSYESLKNVWTMGDYLSDTGSSGGGGPMIFLRSAIDNISINALKTIPQALQIGSHDRTFNCTVMAYA